MDIEKNITHRKILIINLGGIGDVLLSTPALRALKSLFLQATISIVVVPRVYEAISDLSYIDGRFIFYRNPKEIFKNIRTLLTLRRKHFDLAINMRTLVSKRSAKKIQFLLDIINPKVKIGRNTEGRGNFFDIRIPEIYVGNKSEMEYDIETVRTLGVEVIDRNVDFNISKAHLEKVNKFLEEQGVDRNDILVGIHPGGRPCHRWPIENFSEVIEEIHKEISCKFVITGGKEEASLVNKLMKITNAKTINFVDRLNIKELGALIKRCNLFISNDTGPMHIAAILKTPLIAIFGPGQITRFNPQNISSKAIVLYKKSNCAPCEKVKCKSLKCLIAISPEEVIKAALHYLK